MSGVAVAVSSARAGASVALVERSAYLGGLASSAMVGTLCGLYFRSNEDVAKYITSGFAKEFAEKLKAKSKTEPVFVTEGLYVLPYDNFDLKILCDELIKEANVDLYLYSSLYSVKINGNNIDSVSALVWDKNVTFKAKSIVDCTGEASVSALSGIKTVENDEYQSSSVIFAMTDIEDISPQTLNMSILREVRRRAVKGALEADFEGISVVHGSLRGGRVLIKAGIPQKVGGELNRLTTLEFIARKMVDKISKFLKENVPAFRGAHLSVEGSVGVRTGRRPQGLYSLSENDVQKCSKFPDGICNGAWPIEIWSADSSLDMRYGALDDFYQIPAGCLISSDIDNLFFAGRAISASDEAIASARVIGTCLSTGYAAGILAAYRATEKPLDDAVIKIRREQT